MMKENLAIVATMRKVELEDVFATKGDVPSEVVPAVNPDDKRFAQGLRIQRQGSESL